MFDFYERRKLREIVFSRVTAGILFSASLFLAYGAYGRYVAERETREKRTESYEELQALSQRAAALEAKVEYLESERGMEEGIREQFDMVKDNEKVIQIVEKETGKEEVKQREVYPLPEEPSLLDRIKFW